MGLKNKLVGLLENNRSSCYILSGLLVLLSNSGYHSQ